MADHALPTRRPRFDLGTTPLQWVPGDPFTSHWIDVMHLAAPVFERGLIGVYREALPLVADPRLAAALRGFMAQEATHAHAHDLVLAHMRTLGVETAPFVRGVERAWAAIAGPRPLLPLPARAWLMWRLATAAAGEHLTCVLGDWIVASDGLEAAGADPAMFALLRWHGAEEVEHRAVAFDVLAALAGRAAYPLRLAAMAVVLPVLFAVQVTGTRYLLARDPGAAGQRFGRRDLRRAQAQGLLAVGFDAALRRYVRSSFHPDQEGSLERARAVLATM